MIRAALIALVVAYLPGAVVFRLPWSDRAKRAALPAEERLFWHIVISLAWSLAVVLALAALNVYRLDRLLIANGVLIAASVVAARGRLGYHGGAAAPTAALLLPLLLVAIGASRFFPPAEYVIGGKDPGGYINEGVTIAQRGSLVIHEPEVAAIDPAVRTLFFNSHGKLEYFDNRFMGFYLLNPDTGRVVGQFPHLYPASVAIAYDAGGIRAALGITGFWAILGVVAVYLVGARLVGRPAAFATGVLLSLNLIEVWNGRYPNAEVAMQTLFFATFLALARSHQDGDPFFAPVAGVLAALLIFVHFQSLLALAAIGLAVGLAWLVDDRRPRLGFLVPLAIGGVLGWFYWTGPLLPTLWRAQMLLQTVPVVRIALGLLLGAIALTLALRLRRTHAARARAIIPIAATAALLLLAIYAWWLRVPGGRLTDFDAAMFRVFVSVYGLPIGMAAALVGLVLVVPTRFWRDPAFMVTSAAFAVFLFYKLQIVPEHLWLARRFLPTILPSMLLLASAAALGTSESRPRGFQIARVGLGVILLVVLGQQYRLAAATAASHIEFKGLVEHVDQLAQRLTERDLLIVESRNASDAHVLAIPLDYLYGRHVLQLETEIPDKTMFETFLVDAVKRYERVLYLGSGGTDLLSPGIRATPITYVQREAPSYVVTPWNAYRAGIRPYKVNYSLYRLEPGATPAAASFSLDVGFEDDLQVVRFGDKEMTEGRTFRWTTWRSHVAVRGLTGKERELSLVMHDGGRPAAAPPAAIEVFLGDVALGRIAVGSGFREYTLPVPPQALAAAMAAPGLQLRIESTTWKPSQFLPNSPDGRDLGVMIDRVEIR